MKKILSICAAFGLLLSSCSVATDEKPSISERTIKEVISELSNQYQNQAERIEIGVRQAASLWFPKDGNDADFKEFCLNHFIADPELLDVLFNRLQQNFEILYGFLHQINLQLMIPLHVDEGEIQEIERGIGELNEIFRDLGMLVNEQDSSIRKFIYYFYFFNDILFVIIN